MSNRLVRGGLAWAAVAVLAAGCGSTDSDPDAGESNDPVEKQWQARTTLTNCGAVTVAQGESLEDAGADEFKCLSDAFDARTDGELTVDTPTSEGDPITTYYRVLPDGSTETYIDSSKDNYGPRKWLFESCADPQDALGLVC